MLRQSPKSRFIALVVAYAVALQALLSGMALTAHAAAAGAGLARSMICASVPDADLPARQDQAPCAIHCLMAGGCVGLLPPSRGIAAIVAPAAAQISVPQHLAVPGRATEIHPQFPRAPPLA